MLGDPDLILLPGTKNTMDDLQWMRESGMEALILRQAEKKTPVKVYVNEREPIDYGSAQVFGEGRSKTVFGDWRDLGPILEANADKIADLVVENDRRNSAIPLLDMKTSMPASSPARSSASRSPSATAR